eukprot:gene11803-biopygen7884
MTSLDARGSKRACSPPLQPPRPSRRHVARAVPVPQRVARNCHNDLLEKPSKSTKGTRYPLAGHFWKWRVPCPFGGGPLGCGRVSCPFRDLDGFPYAILCGGRSVEQGMYAPCGARAPPAMEEKVALGGGCSTAVAPRMHGGCRLEPTREQKPRLSGRPSQPVRPGRAGQSGPAGRAPGVGWTPSPRVPAGSMPSAASAVCIRPGPGGGRNYTVRVRSASVPLNSIVRSASGPRALPFLPGGGGGGGGAAGVTKEDIYMGSWTGMDLPAWTCRSGPLPSVA